MKRWIPFLLCITLLIPGCASAKTSSTSTTAEKQAEQVQEAKITYTSKIPKENCALCNEGGKTLLPAYAGQNNLGVLSINTFDMSPVEINRYDDHGNLIEKPADHTGITHNTFGEGALSTTTAPNSNRGYADVKLYLENDKTIIKEKVENLLCQDCLDSIMKETWDSPYGVGIINFETLEVRLLEERVTGFSFGDYYIDIDRHEVKDDPEKTELDLLIFYCPPRYE